MGDYNINLRINDKHTPTSGVFNQFIPIHFYH